MRGRVLRLALVLPLLFAALFPVGVMSAQGQGGQTVLVLCSGNGPVQLVLDPVTGEYTKVPALTDRNSCDWALAQVAGDLSLPLALPLPPLTQSRATPAQARLLWRPAHDPRGIWARGPPVLV